MAVWGGGNGAETFGDGALYFPGSDTWKPLSLKGAPTARRLHTLVAAPVGDDEWLFVWGGMNSEEHALNSGAIYSVAHDSWYAMSIMDAPSPRHGHKAMWRDLDNRMVVWGGKNGSVTICSGMKFNPVINIWNRLSQAEIEALQGEDSVCSQHKSEGTNGRKP